MDKFIAPFPMFGGGGSEKALIVAGLLVALLIAARSKAAPSQPTARVSG